MFDVGLTELMVIAIVALVVIGPERLPKVARTAGHILGRLQRYVSDVKSDINREMQLDELKKLQQQVSSQVSSLQTSVTHEMREIESSVNTAVEPLTSDAKPNAAVASAPTFDPVAGTPENIPIAAVPATTEVQKP
ncbi:Sec-independent protein translocase protein TatB [Sulfuritalea sp.]|uniref:Sec-independent protein translocase protein TatB n=1 Tax=Sulfuritalea sp. TaxID=2480090 RepID=UPI001ACAC14F|nr:Sec-independent protein translocase protein TatB [Sulfuritalea sp.]MBN8473529.1 twin-arginine translocase subunit TatB [Sulfuritalea sp.]